MLVSSLKKSISECIIINLELNMLKIRIRSSRHSMQMYLVKKTVSLCINVYFKFESTCYGDEIAILEFRSILVYIKI